MGQLGSFRTGGSFSGKDIALQVGFVANSVYICSRTYLKGLDVSQALGQQKNIHLLTDIAECTGEGELKLKVCLSLQTRIRMRFLCGCFCTPRVTGSNRRHLTDACVSAGRTYPRER